MNFLVEEYSQVIVAVIIGFLGITLLNYSIILFESILISFIVSIGGGG